MAFKMRSGNKPEFKNIGSSPMKKDFEDYDKKDMNLDGTVTRAEKRQYREAAEKIEKPVQLKELGKQRKLVEN